MKSTMSRSMKLFGMVACLLTASSGFAAAVSGPVTQIDFVNGTAAWMPQLLVKVNGAATLYYAQQPSPGCSVPAMSMDSLKIFQSIFMSAMLSGKSVTIYYDTCGSINYIWSVVIVP